MNDPKARMSAILAAHGEARFKTLRKHINALACTSGEDARVFREACENLSAPPDRLALLVVFAITRLWTAAEYFERHSALADSDETPEAAQAQIRENHNKKELVLCNILTELLCDVPRYIEEPLIKFVATGSVPCAELFSEGLAGALAQVAAIRELCYGPAAAPRT